MSAFDRISDIGELLDDAQARIDEAQTTLQELTESIMEEMDNFVSIDEELFIDENDSDRKDPEADKDWENQWFQQTKEFLEVNLRLQLIPMDDIASETKEEISLIEETKSEPDNICQICLKNVDIHGGIGLFTGGCCGKFFHESCRLRFICHDSRPKCPNCRTNWQDKYGYTAIVPSDSSMSDSVSVLTPVVPAPPA